VKKKSLFIGYFLIISLCFITYLQLDIAHTTYSSYAYLDGHIVDFYDFNKNVVGGNDYLPSIYILFAFWNIPLYMLGLASPADVRIYMHLIPAIEVFWSKLFLAFLLIIAIKIIGKIADLIDLKKSTVLSNNAGLLFATAPIAIFAIFIFSQYDIAGLIFSLLGIYYLFKKDKIKFAILFSFAISFKYYALVIFIPLLLWSEKKILKIISYFLIAISVTAMELAFYWHSEIFRGEIFSLVSHKIGDAYAGHSFQLSLPIVFMGLYSAMACILFFKRPTDEQSFYKVAIFACIAAYALMFSSVEWHPQWMILLMPFFALSYRYLSRPGYMVIFDILGMISYLWICFHNFPNNVDLSMANHGIIKSLIPQVSLMGEDFMFGPFNKICRLFFHIYLFSPIILYIFQYKIIKLNNRTLSYGEIFSRVYIGIGLFIILTLLSLYLPKSIVNAINPEAYLRKYNLQEFNKSTGKNVNEILDGRLITQSFSAKSNGLSAVAVQLATYQRKPAGFVLFSLVDSQGKMVASERVDASKIKDNHFYRIKFQSIADSQSKNYLLIIQSDGSSSGAAITAWVDDSNQASAVGGLLVAGDPEKGGLVMQLFYDPSIK
jgi:hypothetical protein